MHSFFVRVLPPALVLLGLCAAPLRAEVLDLQIAEVAHYATPTPAFFAAVVNGDLPALEAGLEEGISPDAAVPAPLPPEMAGLFKPRSRGGLLLNDPGATALMLAVAAGQDAVMARLIAAKANREPRTRSGIRPLDIAAERQDTAAMQMLLGVTPDSEAARLSILVDLIEQKATISRDGLPILVTKVSSGKKEKPTPPGKYVVTQKYTDWRSTLYHNASMPFFLRLSCSTVGLHAGALPGYPASHGCVRLPKDIAQKLYTMIPKGTVVEIRGGTEAANTPPAAAREKTKGKRG